MLLNMYSYYYTISILLNIYVIVIFLQTYVVILNN